MGSSLLPAEKCPTKNENEHDIDQNNDPDHIDINDDTFDIHLE